MLEIRADAENPPQLSLEKMRRRPKNSKGTSKNSETTALPGFRLFFY